MARIIMKYVFITLAMTMWSAQLQADVITDWNEASLKIIREEKVPPPAAARLMAMVHLAMFEAVNADERLYAPYGVTLAAFPKNASQRLSASQAAYTVLATLYPNFKSRLDRLQSQTEAGTISLTTIKESRAFGRTIGAAVLEARHKDGSDRTVHHDGGTNAGEWRPTPPAFQPAYAPHWLLVKPFGIQSGDQFRKTVMPSLTSDDYANAYLDVMLLGSKNSSHRTPEQTEIAHFWADGPGTSTPPGHWNMIAQGIVKKTRPHLLQSARLFAHLNMALADAAIVSWDMKYTYNFWRPITAIRDADSDQNPATVADTLWEPLLTTPPFPECTSGHSTFSGAAANVLAQFIGSDSYNFSTTSDALPGVVRQFTSFSSAAAEAGISRIYGGIHFNFSNVDGVSMGQEVAEYILRNQLTPNL